MGTSMLWMLSMIGLLVLVTVITVEETVRRRGACVRFQRELRGQVRPMPPASRQRHLRIVSSGEHRRVA